MHIYFIINICLCNFIYNFNMTNRNVEKHIKKDIKRYQNKSRNSELNRENIFKRLCTAFVQNFV